MSEEKVKMEQEEYSADSIQAPIKDARIYAQEYRHIAHPSRAARYRPQQQPLKHRYRDRQPELPTTTRQCQELYDEAYRVK